MAGYFPKTNGASKAPFVNYTVRYRLSSQSVLSLCNNSSKTCLVFNSQVSQNLTVQSDGGFVQAGDKLAVAHVQFAASCVDTGNPQRAEYAFLVTAVTVGVLTCLHDSLFGYTEYITATAAKTFGLGNYFLVACACVNTAFYS